MKIYDVEVMNGLCRSYLSIEACGIKVRLTNEIYYTLDVYRPHSGTVDGFTNKLSSMFS